MMGWLSMDNPISPIVVVSIWVVVVVPGVAVSGFVARQSRATRSVEITLAGLLLAVLANRVMGWQEGRALVDTFTTDLLLCAAIGLAGSLFVGGPLRWVGIGCSLAWLAAMVFPDARMVIAFLAFTLAPLPFVFAGVYSGCVRLWAKITGQPST